MVYIPLVKRQHKPHGPAPVHRLPSRLVVHKTARTPTRPRARPPDHVPMDDPLRAICHRLGFFTRSHALEAGYDDRAITREARAHRLGLSIRRGYYTFPDFWTAASDTTATSSGVVPCSTRWATRLR